MFYAAVLVYLGVCVCYMLFQSFAMMRQDAAIRRLSERIEALEARLR